SDEDSFLTRFYFELAGWLRWRLCGWDFRRAGNEFRGRVPGRLVECEKSEKVRQIFFVEQPLDAFGHHREFTHARVLYTVPRDGFLAFTRHPHDDALFVILDDQSGEIASVLGDDGGDLVARTDHQAGIEHIREQLLKGRPAARRKVRPDLGARAVYSMALCAKIAKHSLATVRIADVFAEIGAHLRDDLFALRIP